MVRFFEILQSYSPLQPQYPRVFASSLMLSLNIPLYITFQWKDLNMEYIFLGSFVRKVPGYRKVFSGLHSISSQYMEFKTFLLSSLTVKQYLIIHPWVRVGIVRNYCTCMCRWLRMKVSLHKSSPKYRYDSEQRHSKLIAWKSVWRAMRARWRDFCTHIQTYMIIWF